MSEKQAQILVTDKWSTWIKGGETLEQAALELLTERVNEGYWYYNWDEGNPLTDYEDRAKKIVELQDGKAAWGFLRERSEHEYEQVEEVYVR